MLQAPVTPPKMGTKKKPRDIMDWAMPMALPWAAPEAEVEIRLKVELRAIDPMMAEME